MVITDKVCYDIKNRLSIGCLDDAKAAYAAVYDWGKHNDKFSCA